MKSVISAAVLLLAVFDAVFWSGGIGHPSWPHPSWPIICVLAAMALVMDGLSLEAPRISVRLTFSLPYSAALAVVEAPWLGLLTVLGVVLASQASGELFKNPKRRERLIVHAAVEAAAFAAGLIAADAIRSLGTTSTELILQMCAFIGVCAAVNILGMMTFAGRSPFTALWRSVGDSAWLGGTVTIFYFALAAFVGLLASQGQIWLIPITAVPALVLRSAIASRIKMLANLDNTITALALMLQRAHPYTHEHVDRVADAAERVGRKLGLSRRRARLLRSAAVLHDIGKIAIDEEILDKPAKLTDEEFAKVKCHPETGARILQPVQEFCEIAEWVKFHHERVDGRGYPMGLSGVEIPLESKIIAVVDAFDAMTDNDDEHGARKYRTPKSTEEALRELQRCAGTQFDAEVVAAFIDCCPAPPAPGCSATAVVTAPASGGVNVHA